MTPSDGTSKALVGRWKLERAYFGPSRDRDKTFTGIGGVNLVYVFFPDGRMQIRNEFDWDSPVVRRGTYGVAGRTIRHTAVWTTEGPRSVTEVIELFSSRLLRLRTDSDGVAREFRREER
jgi:hypothetical protein